MRQVPKPSQFSLIFPFFIVIILDAMSTGMMAPVLAPLVTGHGGILGAHASVEMRHVTYGIVLGLWPFCFMIGAPVFGYLSDRWGRKKILIICLLGTLLSFVFYSISFAVGSLVLLLLGRVVGGITSGSQGVAQAAIADISSGKQKAANIGVIAVAMTIGLVVGPLLGGFFSDHGLVSWFNDVTPFYIAIALVLFNLLLLRFFLQETHIPKVNYKETFVSKIKKITQESHLMWLLLIFFCFELAWSLYFQSLALFLVQQFHFANHSIGIFSAYIGLALSLALIYGVRWVLRVFSLLQAIQLGLWLVGMSLVAIFLLPIVFMQYLLVIPMACAVAVSYACLIAQASDWIGNEQQGLLMGLSDAVLALAFTITGFLAGYLSYFNARLPQLIAVGFIALGILLFSAKKKVFLKSKNLAAKAIQQPIDILIPNKHKEDYL